MVTTLIGNLFESRAQTLVNTVNCVGIMGKGVALLFKERFPDMFEDYQQRCERGEVKLGRPYLFKRLVTPWIVNFPTKEHWRSVSRLSDIVDGLVWVKRHYKMWGITSLGVPPLGCGQGGLEWRVVGPTLHRHLAELDIPVELYAPFGTPHEELSETFLGVPKSCEDAPAPRLNPAWVSLVEVVARVEEQPHHWPIGRTSFQKLAYFATVSGIPTGLQFGRGTYGPFAPELRGMLSALVNNGLLAERRLNRMLELSPGPTFPDAATAFQTELRGWVDSIGRVADLFARLHTQEAEIAATVHFAAQQYEWRHKRLPTEAEVLEEVKRWKQRRQPPLQESAVARSIRSLNLLDWIHALPSRELTPADEAVIET